MYDEAVSTFEYIVREDRPVDEIALRRLHVPEPAAGQVLRHRRQDVEPRPATTSSRSTAPTPSTAAARCASGAVLTATSAPLRTSPVKRGDWVLRRILGTPTPPPPADAGSIPADDVLRRADGAAAAGRPQRNATCANCHLRIDPLGFPLEGFDPVGRCARRLQRRQAGRRHRRVRATRRRSPAPRACWTTCDAGRAVA